jgi:C-terminal processing protease CtpA/Prc
MMRPDLLLPALSWFLAVTVCGAAPAIAQQDDRPAFTFSAARPDGTPASWSSNPEGTVSVDSVVVRSLPYAVRLQRDTASPGMFSVLTKEIPVTFTGNTVELRGWLRTEDVAEFAGLWLRVDGPGGTLQFDNMQQRAVRGTTEWTEYRIRMPLDGHARRLLLGALLPGTGTAWVDDLELLVDGRPYGEAARRELSGAELDREFDGGSGIATQPLSAAQVDNLSLLGRVWGFVKYHHPAVTAGQTNWDNELFRVLPAVLEANDRAAASQAITGWLDRLGPPPACEPCAELPADAYLLPEIDWIRDADLGARLSSQLQEIHRNRSVADAQHYRGEVAGVGNPEFSGEAAYPAMSRPDAGFRLLSLFRFWNIVEYWFPYRDIIGEDWTGVLTEFVPELMAADSADEYRLAMMRLSARLNDTHANLWHEMSLRPPRGTAQLPVQVRYVEGRPVVSGFTHAQLGPATGLERGDIIERIGGATVDSLVAAWRPYYSASNEPKRLLDIARTLTRGDPGPVTIGVRRAGRAVELTADRAPLAELDLSREWVQDLPGETFQMLADDVAYLKLSSVRDQDMPEYMRRAAGASVLVVDIRNYPSEFVVFTLGGRLVDEPTEFARFTVGVPANPGAFVWTPPVRISPIEPGFHGRVVVLVNETSLSQAEYTAMALRASPRVTVVGSTTAAADGNVSEIPLPGGVNSMITGIGVFYPDRSPTQRIGIIPDLEVLPTIDGIRAGRDEVLEAGVSHALGREFRLPPR